MMTKVSPQLQTIARDFAERAQEELQRHPTAIDILLSWGISYDSIERYNLGYNPTCYSQTVDGRAVTFFDGITIPIVHYCSDSRQLVEVCCKPINVKEHSLYVFGSSIPIFETGRGTINENTVIVIVDEPMDAIMLESQLDESLNTFVVALGGAYKQIHDVNLKAKMAAGFHVLVALDNTLSSDECANKLILDLGGTGHASRLRPMLRSPLLHWIADFDIYAWVAWPLIEQGFDIPDPDAKAAAAEWVEQGMSEYEADIEANEEFYSRLALDML